MNCRRRSDAGGTDRPTPRDAQFAVMAVGTGLNHRPEIHCAGDRTGRSISRRRPSGRSCSIHPASRKVVHAVGPYVNDVVAERRQCATDVRPETTRHRDHGRR